MGKPKAHIDVFLVQNLFRRVRLDWTVRPASTTRDEFRTARASPVYLVNFNW